MDSADSDPTWNRSQSSPSKSSPIQHPVLDIRAVASSSSNHSFRPLNSVESVCRELPPPVPSLPTSSSSSQQGIEFSESSINCEGSAKTYQRKHISLHQTAIPFVRVGSLGGKGLRRPLPVPPLSPLTLPLPNKVSQRSSPEPAVPVALALADSQSSLSFTAISSRPSLPLVPSPQGPPPLSPKTRISSASSWENVVSTSSVDSHVSSTFPRAKPTSRPLPAVPPGSPTSFAIANTRPLSIKKHNFVFPASPSRRRTRRWGIQHFPDVSRLRISTLSSLHSVSTSSSSLSFGPTDDDNEQLASGSLPTVSPADIPKKPMADKQASTSAAAAATSSSASAPSPALRSSRLYSLFSHHFRVDPSDRPFAFRPLSHAPFAQSKKDPGKKKLSLLRRKDEYVTRVFIEGSEHQDMGTAIKKLRMLKAERR